MAKFDVTALFGINVDFAYFNVYELLSVLGLNSVVLKNPRVSNLIKKHGKKDHIVSIAIRQVLLSELKLTLNSKFMPYDASYHDSQLSTLEYSQRYEAEDKFLLICYSIALGKSVTSIKRLKGADFAKLPRDCYTKGRSLYAYFRQLLDDSTREYILNYKAGRHTTSEEVSEEIPPTDQLKSVSKESSTNIVIEHSPFSKEIAVASNIMEQGIKLIALEVKRALSGSPLDTKELMAFCKKITASYDRNPNALLAIRHIQNTEDYIAQHCLGCAILACHLAKSLTLDARYIQVITMAALVFDLGRFKLPVAITQKAGKLTEAELMLTRKHLNFSEAILSANEDIPKVIYQMLWEHHEKLDGTGYPQGKADGEISVYGKIGAIVDAYDSMTSEQSYKSALTPFEALERMKKEQGVAFDGKLLEVFVSSLGKVPVGSCVELSNGRLAFVLTLSKKLAPSLVRQVYSLSSKTFIAATDLALDKTSEVTIAKVVSPEAFGLRFIDHIS
ncbi:HD-GYP domain-containing protein [Marinomonas ostreistagni]|uniref:HD domain-containing protein n=1 Tax=Marinomonas ostreistagni TaxID=359209 RepID=A0ABS0Z624_9GAMM|nr:HD domain-containing phosphohydrolase [Marinomonas ostreistagni]MBJ7549116.1 HD domain-containing protein [Marinomonas ostreistagni]